MNEKFSVVYVDAKTCAEAIVYVVNGKRNWSSLTPYIQEGYVPRKTKKGALEAEFCAVLEALKNVKGNLIIHSDREDISLYFNGKSKRKSNIEKKVGKIISEIRKLSEGREVIFRYTIGDNNLAGLIADGLNPVDFLAQEERRITKEKEKRIRERRKEKKRKSQLI
jgi:ribonuclease HI